MRDAQGHVNGVLDFSYDVSEQVQARQQLQQLNQELEARVQERTRELDVARAQAEEQRNRLLRLFGQAPAEINLFAGPEHVWTLVHPRTRELLQNRPLQGLPRRQALPELPEAQHELFDSVYRTGQPVHALETTQRFDRFHNGELHDEYFDLTLQPKFDAGGRIEGVMSFAINVTERVRSRQRAEALQADLLTAARRQAQERAAFHNVFEQTPALIALLRAPGHRFEYVNPAYQALLPGRPLLGLDMAVAVPESEEQGFVALLDRVYQTGETFFGAELPFAPEPVDGGPARTWYFNFTYQAYREDGQVAGVTIFAFDVTEQVLARQQREAERQQLHKLFMEAPAPIVILDGPDLVFQLVNPAYQRVFPGRALQGKPVLEAMPEVAGTAIYHSLRGVYDTGETFVEQELPLMLARYDDGPLEEMFFTFTYQARRNAQGEIDGVLAFAHEVTDQVQARRVVEEGGAQARALAEQLHTANEQLTRTNVDLDNFIYTASHDLKVPIANIEGLLQALTRSCPRWLWSATCPKCLGSCRRPPSASGAPSSSSPT
ncbi:PAS domain-containing protein [Hymenobacter humi]|uniref:histidine kinase n=1 Tax=Hymenobacter humi TaxID=1411620 RepID=A0ABW2UGB0_9BACT